MREGLVLTLTALGCLCVGGGLLYRAQSRIALMERIDAYPDAMRFWCKVKFAGIVVCSAAAMLIVVVLNNPTLYT